MQTLQQGLSTIGIVFFVKSLKLNVLILMFSTICFQKECIESE